MLSALLEGCCVASATCSGTAKDGYLRGSSGRSSHAFYMRRSIETGLLEQLCDLAQRASDFRPRGPPHRNRVYARFMLQESLSDTLGLVSNADS